MSADYEEQQRVFDFLKEKHHEQKWFTKDELATHAGWNPQKSTFQTYWSKQFRPLLIKDPDADRYRVSQYFKRYGTWEKFRDNVVTQNRALSPGYQPVSYDKVVVFEFFMPLRNEEHLRAALDTLFYKDFVMARLKLFDGNELNQYFEKLDGEQEPDYFERICEWISDTFVGYSISHVSGRYKMGAIKARKDAFETAAAGEPYLVDETTAVTTFIIPCGKPIKNMFLDGQNQQNQILVDTDWEAQAKRIRWVFYCLFVQSIIEVVNGEDEIWLLERGVCNQLHIWKRAASTEG